MVWTFRTTQLATHHLSYETFHINWHKLLICLCTTKVGTSGCQWLRVLLLNRHSEPVLGAICNFICVFACYLFFCTCCLRTLYINLDYQFLCLHIVLCCLCISIATNPCFWLYCCIFLFLDVCICLYVRRTPWQISPIYGLKGPPVEK